MINILLLEKMIAKGCINYSIYEVGYFDIGTSVEESVDGCKKGNNFGRLGQKGAVSAGQAGRTNIYLSADKSRKMHCNSRLV